MSLREFNRVLKSIAEGLFPLVESKIGESAAWDRAILDIRSPKAAGSLLLKFRIVLPNGSTESARVPTTVNDLIREAWELKFKAFPKRWYGLKLTIVPGGGCETEFDYDPKCFNDPTFFDF